MFTVLPVLSGRTCTECVEIVFILDESDLVRLGGRSLDKKRDLFRTLSWRPVLEDSSVCRDSERVLCGVFGRNIYGLFH